MQYLAKRFQNQAPGLSLDTEALSRYPDLIDLSIGDTDFVTDERIIDAAMKDAKAGYTHYGFPGGDPELIDAICQAWSEDFGQELSGEEVTVTASSCLGMAEALFAILNPGDEVIVIAPFFAVYRQQIELAGGICVEVDSYEEENFRLHEGRLRAAITEKTRAIILNNPCNPTGVAYHREDLELLTDIVKEKDLLLLADEIYTRYVFDGEFIPIRTLPGMKEHVITLNSFSKNFMMTGWRIGCLIGPPSLLRAIERINGGLIYTSPSVSQRAAIKALELREDLAQRYITQYRERLWYAADRIERISYMTLSRPGGTFYLFPGIRKAKVSSARFCQIALEQAHVLLSPGSVFGSCGEGHVRIAVTQQKDKLSEAFDRLEGLAKRHIFS